MPESVDCCWYCSAGTDDLEFAPTRECFAGLPLGRLPIGAELIFKEFGDAGDVGDPIGFEFMAFPNFEAALVLMPAEDFDAAAELACARE